MSIAFFPKASTGEGIIQNGGVNAIVIDSSQNVTIPQNLTVSGTLNSATGAVYPLVSGTAVASTSGTSIDFTGIPSTAKRITVMLAGVSTSGTSLPQIQIGSGSVTTSGYTATASYGGTGNQVQTLTSGFVIVPGGAYSSAASILSGAVTLLNISGNNWVSMGAISGQGGSSSSSSGVSPTLSGTLDRVRITTVNGTDTFDAGSVNILWE